MFMKSVALVFALAFSAILLVAPAAHARRGDDVPLPPECQTEDGGIVVCK